MKKRVICDANVWYGFANGELNIEDYSSVNLVCTKVTIEELSTSENMLDERKILLVQKTLKIIFTHASDIILINPILWLVKCGNPNFHIDLSSAEERLEELKFFSNMDNQQLLEISQNSVFQEGILKYDKSLKSSVDSINALTPLIKNNIKATIGKRKHRRKENSEKIQNFIKMMIEKLSLNTGIDWNNYPWSKIFFFIKIWDIFDKELELSGMKLEKNDWYDLYNMIYVDEESKYLTLEKKWNRFINSDLNTRKYQLIIK